MAATNLIVVCVAFLQLISVHCKIQGPDPNGKGPLVPHPDTGPAYAGGNLADTYASVEAWCISPARDSPGVHLQKQRGEPLKWFPTPGLQTGAGISLHFLPLQEIQKGPQRIILPVVSSSMARETPIGILSLCLQKAS